MKTAGCTNARIVFTDMSALPASRRSFLPTQIASSCGQCACEMLTHHDARTSFCNIHHLCVNPVIKLLQSRFGRYFCDNTYQRTRSKACTARNTQLRPVCRRELPPSGPDDSLLHESEAFRLLVLKVLNLFGGLKVQGFADKTSAF